tara:strand:+ start:26377 stop:26502 length:126 start_codon:yes stop_codon:yes gene_type:complete
LTFSQAAAVVVGIHPPLVTVRLVAAVAAADMAAAGMVEMEA